MSFAVDEDHDSVVLDQGCCYCYDDDRYGGDDEEGYISRLVQLKYRNRNISLLPK
uniref:Uncharacterized protein n=1 Tax=Tetranychus urticae TaxID=32264 RepID=T1KZ65_TETUR